MNLVEEGFDLALRVSQSPGDTLVARPVGSIAFQLVAAPAYLAAGRLIALHGAFPVFKAPIYGVYPSRRFLPSRVRSFLEFLAADARLEQP